MDNSSEINMSMPYEELPGRNMLNNVISQDDDKYKWRPISAAVVRSANVKIKEPQKREFKIWDLQDENKIKNIIQRNDYEDQNNMICSFEKEKALPVKSYSDKPVALVKKTQKMFNIKRLSWESKDRGAMNKGLVIKEKTVATPMTQPSYMRSKNRINNQTPFEKQDINKAAKSNTGLQPKVSQIRNINQPIMNNLFSAEDSKLNEIEPDKYVKVKQSSAVNVVQQGSFII